MPSLRLCCDISRALPRFLPVIAGFALGLTTAGCSFSYRLDSLFSKDDPAPEHTGSVSTSSPPSSTTAAESDLDFARAAAREVLGGGGGKDASAPWTNPRTGARGTVTPIATAYNQDGFTCRDFLASYVREGAESWLQGEACRMHQGKWEVRSLKPWKKS